MYERREKYENLDLTYFCKPCGAYDIPELSPVHISECPELIDFNAAVSASNPNGRGVHFFIDDYRFVRVWNNPTRYVPLLSKFSLVFTPDFSLYTDYPRAMQIYNHYRKHALGAYWQSEGLTVVPTICWSDEDSFEWCFDGEPKGGTVAVSSVGTQASKESKAKFLAGYNQMLDRLYPENIIFNGNVPDECGGNIIRVRAFQEKFRDRLTGN